MKYTIISDLHVRNNEDTRYELLLNFISSREVEESDIVIFLGDIFDQFIGPHIEYLHEYSDFFKELNYLLKSKTIWWFEGNHDFHVEKFFKKYITNINEENFEYIKDNKIFNIGAKRVYMGHGDELDHLNDSYMKYRKFIRGRLSKFIIERLLSFSFLCIIKEKFSNKSKEMQKDFDFKKSKEKYLSYVDSLRKDFDLILLGHSHIFEDLHFYKNVGFPPEDKKFLKLDSNDSLMCSLA